MAEPSPLSPSSRARLEELLAAASPGGWEVPEFWRNGVYALPTGGFRGSFVSPADAAYVVAAHNALPHLLADLDRALAALRAVEELADRADNDADAYDALARSYRGGGHKADSERCDQLARHHRATATRLRALLPASPTTEETNR